METLGTSLRLLRRHLRRGRQWLRYRHLDSPVLFGNSFPKSGTHLLTQVLAGFSRFGPVVNSGLPDSGSVAMTVACTIVLSIIAHGITANPWARAYGKRRLRRELSKSV